VRFAASGGIAQSKSGKSRRIPLTDEGRTLCGTLADGKPEGAVLLTKSGAHTGKNQNSPGAVARRVRVQKIDPPISFQSLTHSYASSLGEGGTPLAFVADALGHTDTRMVGKHYAHLAPNYI
jgi:integrase